MATQTKTPQQKALERVLERGRKDSERARQLLGCDPGEALDRFARETYDYETLLDVYVDIFERGNMWDDADVIDER